MPFNDFLPNFKRLFPGRPRLNSQAKKEQKLAKAKQYNFDELRLIFEALLPSKLFDVESGSERKRVFTRELTFWSFFYQTLSGVSCCGVLKAVQCWFESKGRPLPSSNNSAYCQARKRLSYDFLADVFGATVENSSKQNNKIDRHWGRDVKVVDGTSFRMPDTEENQQVYPQHSGAKKGCSFPYTTTVALFSLSTRALHAFKSGSKNDSEKVLWRDIWSAINNNDIVLGDRGFCSYVNIVSLKKYHGADSVFRLGIKVQKIHFEKCQKISKNQWLDTWTKPKAQPKYLSKKEWNDIPESMDVRIVKIREYKPGFRSKDIYIATSLLDHKKYKIEEIESLYMTRWQIEVFFRDIKESLGVRELKTKTPALIKKEFLMVFIAYNLICSLMLGASRKRDVSHFLISFKGTVNQLSAWLDKLRLASYMELRRLRLIFYDKISDKLLLIRPGRSEPRAKKRRAKNYQLLNKPRAEMIVGCHRGHPRRKNALAPLS